MERKFLLGASEGSIAAGGRTDYSILITDQADAAVEYAAAELSRLVKKATGAILPIIREKTGPVISLGDNSYSKSLGLAVTTKEVTRHGFMIKTVDDDVIIVSSGKTGLIYAMQRYLELNMDYMYYTADEVRYGDELVKRELDVIDFPDILNRDVYNFSTKEIPENAVKLYQCGAEFSAWEDKYGEGGWWSSLHDQSLVMQLVDFHEYREKYPQWYYGGPGKPFGKDPQLCYTEALYSRDEYDKGDWNEPNYNDGRHGLFWTLVYNLINNYIAVETTKSLFQLGMSDNDDYCDCDRCNADVEKYGRSGVAVRFANAVADEVKKWQQENCPEREIYLTMFAYSCISEPPTKIVNNEWIPLDKSVIVRDNIVMRYAPIKENYMFSLLDKENNPGSYNEINGWTKVAHRFAIWDYRVDFHSICAPFPQWITAQENIRLYKQMGAVDVLHQGCRTTPNSTLIEMDNWVRNRMLWDTTLEYETLADQFVDAYYGVAGDAMREYRAYLTDHYWWCNREFGYKGHSHHGLSWHGEYFPTKFTRDVEAIFAKGYAKLDELKSVNPDRYELEKKRFDLESLFYRYTKLVFNRHDYDIKELTEETNGFREKGDNMGLRVWFNTFDQFWVTAKMLESLYPDPNHPRKP